MAMHKFVPGKRKPATNYGAKNGNSKEARAKREEAKTIKVEGESHTIKKNKKGEVIVDHAGNKGKYDKINLTKKAGSKTIKQGVKATKDWHKKNG